MNHKSFIYIIVGCVLLLLGIGAYVWRNIDLNFQLAKVLIGDPPPVDELYPPSPHDIPECVSTPLPELLASYERVLAELGVDVQQSLQAGLTDQDLDALAQEYSCEFSQDIRLLYKWHNGTPDSVSVDIFPLGKFMPLDQTLERKNRPTKDSSGSVAHQFMEEWLAFRKSWIEITADGAGNGHYYDPERIDRSSSFFYHAHDDVPYDFYPCLGNWIQSILDLHSQDRLVYNDGWIQVAGLESYEEDTLFINRYGRRVE